MLTDAISQLYAAVVTNLTLKYIPRHGSQDALLLAGCVLSEAMMEPPYTDNAARYQRSHSASVRDAALQIAADPDVAAAFAYLYAAKTVQLVFVTGSPFSELARALGKRATELAIDIPNTYDICGSGDALTCIHAIADFAKSYRDRAFGREPSAR
jgi:hypothetical protein